MNPLLIYKSEFFSNLITFVFIIIFMILNLSDIKKQFRRIKQKHWILLFTIIALGFVFRLHYLIYHGQILPPDSFHFLHQAKNMLINQQNAECIFGNSYACFKFVSWYTSGFAFLIVIPFIFIGFNYMAPIFVSFVTGLLSILLIFLLTYQIFKKAEISLYAAFLMSVLPFFIKFSTAALNNITSMFFILLCFFVFFFAEKVKTKKSIFLTLLILAFAVTIRAENFVIVAILILLSFVFRFRSFIKFYSSWCFFIILCIPTLLHIFLMGYGTEPFAQNFSLQSFFINLVADLKETLVYFHILFFVLLGIGMLFLYKKNKKFLIFLGAWFFPFSMILLCKTIPFPLIHYYAAIFPVLVIFCALGIFAIFKWLGKKSILVKRILFLFLLFSFLCSYFTNFDRTDTHLIEVSQTKPNINNILSLKNQISDDCYLIIEHATNLNFLWGKKVVYFNDNLEAIDKLIKQKECVLLYESGLTNVKQFRQESSKRYDFEVAFQTEGFKETLALYKVSLKS